jgi:hypothetical protein
MSKNVQIVETGEYFRSAAHCARTLGVSTGMVVHCLKGRRKTVAGCTVIYAFVPWGSPRYSCPRRIIYDDTGRWYEGYSHIARIHHLTPAKARSMTIGNGGVFPTRKAHHNDLFGPL